MNKSVRIFDPTTTPKEQPLHYASRPATLQGKKVGLVDNTKLNSGKLLLKIGKILEEQYGARGLLLRSKRNAGVPAHDEILDELSAECDVMVAGVGD
ncbi:MAG: hypothetical protein ACE5JU_02375 [Candidatus Binatia bacterium]